LAATNPAAHLPDLAGALNILSVHQSGAGDHDAALTSITEAVEHYGRLATANPAAHLPNLAMALNNLSNHQSGTGDHNAALTSATEALEHYRQLATTNPAAHLPDLAMALNNLSNHQSATGDRDAALYSIVEAVEHYRQLATTNPAAHIPDLAMALNNLSNHQSATGDRDAALTSSTEAVEHYRQLATTNPAAHIPDLAGALNNLSNHQSGTGDHGAALSSATEAVEHHRRLAATNPAAHLPDLAGALNNLSNHQFATGDREAALTSATEAVEHHRRLATASPAAHLPHLAMALNNLSVRQSEAGDRDAGLNSSTEAVEHYRQLATANPAAHLPDLAMALNNLSNHQSSTGDHDTALTSATEAVDIRRRLAAANPAAHLPSLARALNNLSNRQSGTGDHDTALTSITEAVEIRRQLATANPAAHLPDLARALNNLSNHQSATGDRNAQDKEAWSTAIAALQQPAARAELRAAWATVLMQSGQSDSAMDALNTAVHEADQPLSDNSPPHLAPILVARARQLIRALVPAIRECHVNLPPWAGADIPETDRDLINDFAAADGWPAQHVVLDAARERLLSLGFRSTLDALIGLYPSNPVPGQLLRFVESIGLTSIDDVFAQLDEDHDRRTLLTDWIAKATWVESRAFLADNREALLDERLIGLLSRVAAYNTTSRQHLAILELASGQADVAETYELITDPDRAEDAVLTAIERGNLRRVATILAATDALEQRPLTSTLATAVLLLANGEPDQARELVSAVVEDATAIQRRAHTIRLRALAAGQPDLDGVDTLIALLAEDRQPREGS
jgi:tetratricopeptide (TPR) repeat protein